MPYISIENNRDKNGLFLRGLPKTLNRVGIYFYLNHLQMKNFILFLSVLFLFSMALPATSTNNVEAETVEVADGWCWATYSVSNGITRCSGSADDCTKPCKGKTVPVIR